MQPFIVAEISKNWDGTVAPTPRALISQLFEAVLVENARRGYELHSFQLHRVMIAPDQLNETIIAVFVLSAVVIKEYAPTARGPAPRASHP